MYIVTAAEMRNIDQRTIETYHVPGIVLMENAGLQLLRFMQDHLPSLQHRRVTIITGGGNNGGDGFIVARHLWQQGVQVDILLLVAPNALSGDARTAYEMAQAYGVPMQHCTTAGTWKKAFQELHKTDILVDAIFGTGVNRPVSDLYAEVIRALNTLQKPIVAVDIPSGVAADHGNVFGEYIRATYTVTFALPKRGLLLYPAAAAVGTLHVANIGIPQAAIAAEKIQIALLDMEEIRQMLPARAPDSHKGSHGHLLVVAGSPGKSGAGVLASQAALRAGAGLVTLALPKSMNPAIEAAMTEVMTLPAAENATGELCAAALPHLCQFLAKVDALVLGPGLGTHQETISCVHALLRQATVPIVLDADGLNSLIGHLDVLQDCQVPIVLTPHPGEMARLLDISTAAVQAQRLDIVQDFAKRYQVYVVLKGARTVIYAPNGQRWVNPTGNVAMATAGTGDVLAGIIGAFLCQGLQPLQAAQCGVYLHGMAGDRVCDRLGESGLIASDLIAELPYTTRAVRERLVCTL